jgi:hypothetical protein
VIQHIPDHVERTLAYIPGYHRLKTGVRALYEAAIGYSVQELEDLIYDAALGEQFSVAKGPALTRWGETYGVPRLGLEDDVWYRRLVIGTVQMSKCTGTADELIRAWAAFTAGQVELTELPLRGLQLVAWRDTYMPEGYAKRAADTMRLRAPGAALVLIEALNRNYLGGSARTSAPYGARNARGIPARVH